MALASTIAAGLEIEINAVHVLSSIQQKRRIREMYTVMAKVEIAFPVYAGVDEQTAYAATITSNLNAYVYSGLCTFVYRNQLLSMGLENHSKATVIATQVTVVTAAPTTAPSSGVYDVTASSVGMTSTEGPLGFQDIFALVAIATLIMVISFGIYIYVYVRRRINDRQNKERVEKVWNEETPHKQDETIIQNVEFITGSVDFKAKEREIRLGGRERSSFLSFSPSGSIRSGSIRSGREYR
jgi:hypothetical protein